MSDAMLTDPSTSPTVVGIDDEMDKQPSEMGETLAPPPSLDKLDGTPAVAAIVLPNTLDELEMLATGSVMEIEKQPESDNLQAEEDQIQMEEDQVNAEEDTEHGIQVDPAQVARDLKALEEQTYRHVQRFASDIISHACELAHDVSALFFSQLQQTSTVLEDGAANMRKEEETQRAAIAKLEKYIGFMESAKTMLEKGD